MSSITRAEQAAAAWKPIVRDASRRRWRKTVIREGPWPFAGRASLWALSQVVQAAVDLVAIHTLDIDKLHRLLRGVEDHRHGDAYDVSPGSGERYYDDNAWLALALLDAAEVGVADGVARARRLLGFVREGERDGGIYWVERPRRSRHTCSTGPAAQIGFRLAAVASASTPIDAVHIEDDRRFAEAAMAFLVRELRGPDGLFADSMTDDGAVDPTLWSYNQGTPIGAGVLWHQLTADPAPLDAARETASAAITHFTGDDRLWQQPPAFNAIFLRNLLLLDEVARFPDSMAMLDAYLDRAWRDARDPATGWFTGGGIGQYERGGSIDQAAFVQLYARAAHRGG
jgi:predicted alpha-1,6-mannanase (GH76 family)